MKSKLLSIVFFIIVLIGVGALIVPSFLDLNKYKGKVVTAVKDKTGYDITLDGDISAGLLPLPHVSLEKVSVTNRGSSLATLESLSVSVELLPLFSKNIKIDDVTLVEPVINAAIDSNGKGNWENDILMAEEDVAPDETMTTESSTSFEIKDFSIDDLIIENGKITYSDEQTNAKHVVTDLNVKAEIEGAKGPYQGAFTFKYNDKDYDIEGVVETIADMKQIPVKLEAALDGDELTAEFRGIINVDEKSVSGRFDVEGEDISEYAGDHASGEFNASGNIAYAQNIIKLDEFKAQLAGLEFEGDIQAQDTQKFVLDIRETTKSKGEGLIGAVLSGASIKSDITMLEKAVKFSSFDMNLKDTTLKGSGTYNFDTGLTLSLNAGTINADEWMKLAGIDTDIDVGEDDGLLGGELSEDEVEGVAIPMNMDLDLNIGKFVYDGKTYQNIKADMKATAGNSLTITNLSLKAPHNTDVAVKGSVDDTKNIRGIDLKTSLKTDDMDALLKSYGVSKAGYNNKIGGLELDAAATGNLNSLGFSAKGKNKGLTLTVSGQAQDPLEQLKLKGLNIRVQHANMVNAIQIVQPDFSMNRAWQKPLDLTIGLDMSGDVLTIKSLKGKAGPVPIESAQMSIDTSGDIPALMGKLALGALVLPEASTNASGASANAGRNSANNGSKWSTAPIESSWMNSANVDLDISAKRIEQNKWVLISPSLAFDMKNGALNISNLSASMFNGSIKMQGKIVAANGGKGFSSMSMSANAQTLSAQSLYSAIKGSNSNMITGSIKRADQTLSTSGASMADLVKNLNGNMNIDGERIVINGVDISNFARAANGDFRGLNSLNDIVNNVLYSGKTEFTTLDASFDIKNGIVNMNPVVLDGPQAKFDVTGNVNLPLWTIDIKNMATVKGQGDDVPPFEMTFRGSLDNPVKSAGGDALRNLVNRKLKDLIKDSGVADKLNEKIGIDIFGGNKATNDNEEGQNKQPTAEDAIRGAIGGLLNGL